ncbi:hypothetical protein J2X98_003142 [Pseudarthrobacter enclensis]|uniref:Uncharacterized protein n=1 Tax=Pseudarthrobacter enclensis TaxID=993070 RepID=A0ABT9RWB5_9MICC|nr:hypothetical protein [Pseudarthrobacter enclensis]
MGSDNFYKSAELLTHIANPGTGPAFTLTTG